MKQPKRDSSISLFCFTETQPTPLVKDFDSFLQYIQQNLFPLSKGLGQIPFKHLVALNQMMTHPNTENTPRTPQKCYPQLDLYYHLALAGNLLKKTPQKSSTVLQPTDRIDIYRSLSAAEKYFFLLETLWVDCYLGQFVYQERSEIAIRSVERLLEKLSSREPYKPISREDVDPWGMLWGSPFLIHCFEFFGWYKAHRDEKSYREYPCKSFYPLKSLTPSALGVTIAPILIIERPLEEWNLPYRRSRGELIDLPGLSPQAEEKDYIPFFAAFQEICQDKLQNTLPRKKREFVKGNFIFKVSLMSNIWRKIALSGEDSLDDLHLAIQDTFEFNADHLYAFFMDNRVWSEYRFEAPEAFEFSDSEREISAAEVRIGDLNLIVNQHILYLFDFGDQWEFDVHLLEVRKDEPLLRRSKILEVHGESPEQYPRYD